MENNKYSVILMLCFQLLIPKFLVAKQINEVKIVDQKLMKAIDDFLSHEKYCDYYSEKLIFEIHIEEYGDTTRIQINSAGRLLIELENEIGVMYCNNHLFYVVGTFKDSLLEKTKRKLSIEYDELHSKNDSETGETIFDVIPHNYYTIWLYSYINDELKILKKFNYCDSVSD